MSMFGKLKRKKKRTLYFALVVADQPTDNFKFEADKDCTMFMISGEVEKRMVIPPTVLKEIVDRFSRHDLGGEVVISEEKK